MYDRMQELSSKDIGAIHDVSMSILSETGIVFKDEKAVETFKKHGFKVNENTVFFTEKQVQTALESCPSRFTVTARNPEKRVDVGGDDFVFAPGYGAPFIVTEDGEHREATMEDYDNFCKLVHTSAFMDMNGFMMVEPSDVPAATAHLDMIRSNILLSDKPFMGAPVSRQGSIDCAGMLELVWGKEAEEKTFTVSLINSLSPLAFSGEMAASLMELANRNQACIIAALIMAGTSGPITIAGVLAQQNAEILAGITLAQLVRKGAPVVYGSTSAPTDMRTGGLSIGAAELSIIVACTAQMARYYNLPCRSGGCLTDSHVPDAQAGAQSCMALMTAARNGVNFILHAAGILGSYIGMSYEKYLIDEELCGMARTLIGDVPVNENTLQREVIHRIGPGGQFLAEMETLERCRTEFFFPTLMVTKDHAMWKEEGMVWAHDHATELLKKRLASYEKPPVDEGLEKSLDDFVKKVKAERA